MSSGPISDFGCYAIANVKVLQPGIKKYYRNLEYAAIGGLVINESSNDMIVWRKP